jgi:ParB-like chromosome segregation protein Spo0J
MRMKITYKSPAYLKPRINNPRTHTKKQIQQIGASIKEFGFINPVLIDGADGIIAGHGRVEAAKLIGMSDVPAVCVDHLTPAQVRAYVIADNKLAENAGLRRCSSRQKPPAAITLLWVGFSTGSTKSKRARPPSSRPSFRSVR